MHSCSGAADGDEPYEFVNQIDCIQVGLQGTSAYSTRPTTQPTCDHHRGLAQQARPSSRADAGVAMVNSVRAKQKPARAKTIAEQKKSTARDDDKRTANSDETRQIVSPESERGTVERLVSPYTSLVALSLTTSLITHFTHLLLEPMYNSIPLRVHNVLVYTTISVLPVPSIWLNRDSPGSIRTNLANSAVWSAAIATFGRTTGSLLAVKLGTEWGAVVVRIVSGVGVIGGLAGHAFIRIDEILPPEARVGLLSPAHGCARVIGVTTLTVLHVLGGGQAWSWLLSGNTSAVMQYPELSIAVISTILSALAIFHPSTSTRTIAATSTPGGKPRTIKIPTSPSRRTPSLFILLTIQIALVSYTFKRQLDRPEFPFLAANNTLRVLSSARSVTGQIVVAEDIEREFRFLRCDASLLGGRWVRYTNDGSGAVKWDLGDSIFATFPLQEIGIFAHRSDPTDTLTRSLSLATGSLIPESSDRATLDRANERVLIIGLGVGISASAYAQRSYPIDIVEVDPLVYSAARDYFNLAPSLRGSVNLVDGASYVADAARRTRDASKSIIKRAGAEDEGENGKEKMMRKSKWGFVIQDCFSGGMVPGEMFTREFWDDLRVNLVDDAVVVVNFVGVKSSKAARAVIVTLLSSFAQCRAFEESINMVVVCTPSYSPLLSFRSPRTEDALGSPLRQHVFASFLEREVALADILSEADWKDDQMLLRRGKQRLNEWQVETGLNSSQEIQKLLSPEMWRTF